MAAKTAGTYYVAHPDGPQVHPLTGATERIGDLHAQVAAARTEGRWAAYAITVAQQHEDPAVREAEVTKLSAYRDAQVVWGLAARERLEGVWAAKAQREATRDQHLAVHAPEILEDEAGDTAPAAPAGFGPTGFDGIGRHHATRTFRDPAGYDVAGYDLTGHDRSGWTRDGRHVATGTRWSPESRDQAGYDKAGFDDLGYHVRTGTLVGPTAENAEQAHARMAKTAAAPAPAPAPAPVAVAPQLDRLALYSQWNDRDDLVSAAATAELLGVDAAGLAALTASGRMPVAVQGDGYRPATFTFGSVLDVAGPLSAPPARVTRAMLQEHTAWRHGEELTRIGAWRVREAQRTQARVAAGRVAA